MQVQLQSIHYCQYGIRPGAIWTGEVQASEDAYQLCGVKHSLLTSPQGTDVEKGNFPSHVLRQIVCLFFSVSAHTPPPKSNSVDMSSLVRRQALTVVLKRGLCMLGWPWGSFRFHQRGQPLSKSLLLPSSLSAIHHRWWMGNGEAIAFSFTALYHFW